MWMCRIGAQLFLDVPDVMELVNVLVETETPSQAGEFENN